MVETAVQAKAADLIKAASFVVVLTGAGVSQESGVPTFRGKDGLWDKYDVTTLATLDAFIGDPEYVWKWYDYRRNLLTSVRPNEGHYALTRLEDWCSSHGKEFSLVTQNIDDLHRVAGSKRIYEIHGNIWQVKCLNACTNKIYEMRESPLGKIPPECPDCNGILRPNIVWFGEMLDPFVIHSVEADLLECDLLFTVGTSTTVYPAASFPLTIRSRGHPVIEINVEETEFTPLATLFIKGLSGHSLPGIVDLLS